MHGPKKTLCNRFVRWSERGIWEGVFSALAGAGDVPGRLFINSSCIKAHRCIEAMPPVELVADKGYDSQSMREWLQARGTEPVILPRKNRKIQYHYDRAIYNQRNVIERMACRLKDWRRVATRFNRNIKNFMGAVSLAAAVTRWL